MISYYNSKHPGLFIYITLVIVSVLSFLLLEINAPLVGILSISWGGFIFMRILSLYEVSEHFAPFTQKSHSKITNKNSSALAHDLIRRMNGEAYMKRGIFAMHAIEGRTLLWFALAFAYVAYSFYLSQNLVSQTALIQKFSIFFIIGAGFWAGQTYSYSDHASRLLLVIFALLFGMSLHNVSTEFDINALNISTSNALTVLAALMVYCFIGLFYSSVKGWSYILNALIGLLLLIIMGGAGLALEDNPQLTALWLSGWSLFSIFWIRSHCRTQKRYILYQCE